MLVVVSGGYSDNVFRLTDWGCLHHRILSGLQVGQCWQLLPVAVGACVLEQGETWHYFEVMPWSESSWLGVCVCVCVCVYTRCLVNSLGQSGAKSLARHWNIPW